MLLIATPPLGDGVHVVVASILDSICAKLVVELQSGVSANLVVWSAVAALDMKNNALSIKPTNYVMLIMEIIDINVTEEIIVPNTLCNIETTAYELTLR